MMVFPFKQVYEGKNKGITMDDEKYNGTNYAIDYEDLAALGLVGDMMNMMDFETHYII